MYDGERVEGVKLQFVYKIYFPSNYFWVHESSVVDRVMVRAGCTCSSEWRGNVVPMVDYIRSSVTFAFCD